MAAPSSAPAPKKDAPAAQPKPHLTKSEALSLTIQSVRNLPPPELPSNEQDFEGKVRARGRETRRLSVLFLTIGLLTFVLFAIGEFKVPEIGGIKLKHVHQPQIVLGVGILLLGGWA